MRWLFRALAAVLFLILIGVILVLMIPAERVAEAASREFRRMTGRDMVVEGGVSPTFWPVLGVTTGPVRIGNADWSQSDADFLTAESLTIQINAASLFGGEVRILGLSAEAPVLVLERSADGRENWDFGSGDGPDAVPEGAGSGGSATPFSLTEGTLTGGKIRYVDQGVGTDVTLDAVDLTLRIPDLAGPVTLNAEAIVNGRAVSLTLEAGVFSAFAEGRVVPLTVALAAGGSTLRFDGRGGLSPLMAEGALSADLSDMAALAGLAGADAPDLPQGLGAERLAIAGQLTLDGTGRAYLRGARIQPDGNVIEGDLDIAQGEARPKLSAQLRAGALNLSGLSGGQGGGAGGGMGAESWPADPIDVSGLAVVDAEIALTATSVDLGVAKFGRIGTIIKLDRSRAVFDIRQMEAYGGAVTGEFVVSGRGGLSVGGQLSLASLQMQPLLTDLSGWDRLTSTGNMTLRFLGVGDSVAALMASLEGEGSFSLGQGELKGLDIAGMLRTLDPGYVGEGQRTIFDGIAAGFTIAGGVLSNSDLRFTAPYVTATGAGTVDLGRRRLDYRLRPTALAAADGTGGVMVPLLITGPWASPNFALDLEGIARERMEEEARAVEERLRAEAAKAEARARAEIEARLAEEGVVVQEGESLEDAARRAAEDALDAEARRLLEGLLGGN